jgi:WD40 repeat protein
MPNDTISDLCFSDQERLLAVTSWDGTVRIWQFSEDYGRSQLQYDHKDLKMNAILRCAFAHSSTALLFSDSQGQIWHWAFQNGTPRQIFNVDEDGARPILGLKWCEELSLFAAVSIVPYPNPDHPIAGGFLVRWIQNADDSSALQATLNAKPICLACDGTELLIASVSEPVLQSIRLSNLKPGSAPLPSVVKTAVQRQIRCVAFLGHSRIVGTIYGEVELANATTSLVLKPHWNEQQGTAHASNAVAICPNNIQGALSAGGDGTLVFFNLETLRQARVIKMSQQGFPLTALAISSKGEVAAVAQGYDWSKGAEKHVGKDTVPICIYIKRLVPNEFG